MSIRAFFYRSFGILALFASVFAAFACRGPWLAPLPASVVLIPVGLSALFFYVGIKLLKAPVVRSESPTGTSVLTGKVVIGLTALAGIILTSYFHGNTPEDQKGLQTLHYTATHYLILAPILLFVIVVSYWRNKKSASAGSNDTPRQDHQIIPLNSVNSVEKI